MCCSFCPRLEQAGQQGQFSEGRRNVLGNKLEGERLLPAEHNLAGATPDTAGMGTAGATPETAGRGN